MPRTRDIVTEQEETDQRVVVKEFPVFDDFTFGDLVYRDLTGIEDVNMIESAYVVLGNYVASFRYHECASGPQEVDRNGVKTTDLSLEECEGDYAPRSFAAFDQDGNCLDAMNFHACLVMEREGERRPTKRYMRCRAYVTLISLDDADYAIGQGQFYKWMVDHTFTMASGPDIEFVHAELACNPSLAHKPSRLQGAVDRIHADPTASPDHEGTIDSYGTEPGWVLLDVLSKFRDGDVIIDSDRRFGGG